MTVKMASDTVSGGVLYLFLVAVVLVSSANSKSSMLSLAINTWPCTNYTEKGQFYAVILILAMQQPSAQPNDTEPLVYISRSRVVSAQHSFDFRLWDCSGTEKTTKRS